MIRRKAKAKQIKSNMTELAQNQDANSTKVRRTKIITKNEENLNDISKDSKEIKKKKVEASINRLFSPTRKVFEEKKMDAQDMIFTIKMTKEEYTQFNKTKEFYRTSKKVKI